MAIDRQSTSRFVQTKSMKLHYHEAGSGPVLMLVHGSGPGATAWSNFQKNIEFFAKDFRVIAPDLPCYGESDRPTIPSENVFSYLSAVIRDFMDALEIGTASFVGNSLGGGTSVKFALDYPERLDKLILMGSGGGVQLFVPSPSEGIKVLFNYYKEPGPTREKLRDFLRVMVYDHSLLTEELIEQRFLSSTRPEVIAHPPFPKQPKPEYLYHRLSEITAKTLVIWGRDDRTVSVDSAFIMLSQIPDVRLHVFGKCGHWTQWEKADEFNVLVRDFVKL